MPSSTTSPALLGPARSTTIAGPMAPRRRAAAEGSAVLVASTDTEELVRLSHRILILRDGVIATELVGDEITVENIERAQLQQQTKSKVSHS